MGSICQKLSAEWMERCVAWDKAGLQLGDVLVLLALMADMDEEGGETTSVSTVLELAQVTGRSYDQVGRILSKLKARGLVAREQRVKRAGEPAFTTLLPAGYRALGLASTETSEAASLAGPMPKELVDALCGQSWAVIDGVQKAWENRESLPAALLNEMRGGPRVRERVDACLTRRRDEAALAMEAAVAEAKSAEELREQGLAVVRTKEGSVVVDVRAFEAGCPVPVPWQYVADVMNELSFRDPNLVTQANLAERMAEAAYARIALPFVKNNGWEKSVVVLAKQMATNWSRPRRIWKSWYVAADQALIHKAA